VLLACVLVACVQLALMGEELDLLQVLSVPPFPSAAALSTE
jgi:hypothetical protein